MVRYQAGQDHDARRFAEVLDAADGADEKRLRAAAGRLAGLAHGPLRQALQQFRFEVLDLPSPLFGGELPLPAELLGGDEGVLEEVLQALIDGAPEPDSEVLDLVDELSELEEFIDENGLRGAPLPMLKDFAGALKSNPQTRREWAETARACEAENLSDSLSPELYFLLFARKKKNKHR